MATARCLICGRFYSERGPEPAVCPAHIYDWNTLADHQRAQLTREAIYRPSRLTGSRPPS